jgi:hypothetical protein
MKKRTTFVCYLAVVYKLNASVNAQEGKFVTFDVPGSACQASFARCTTPVSINQAGSVTGSYTDANARTSRFPACA